MRNTYLYSISALLLASLFLFPTSENEEIELQCSSANCQGTDSLFIFEFNGISFNKNQAAALVGDLATFNLPQTEPRFYYVGPAANNVRPVIIGSEKKVAVNSRSCSSFRMASVNQSDLNTKYEELKKTMTNFNNEMRGLNNELRQKMGSEAGMKEMHQKYVELDNRKLALFEKLKKEDPYLSKAFSLNTYMSYQVNGSQYPNELAYFAKEYFQLVNWSDPDLDYMPWVFESLKSYSTTLSSVPISVNEHKFYIGDILAKIPADSRAYKLALGGVLAGLEQKSHGNYKHFADLFIQKFEHEMPKEAEQLKKKVKSKASMMIGAEAPDFTMNSIDGTPVALSSFKGKVTLIDFWASWCGPCRRENPYVAKLYKKYKDHGFEILGVSLDNNKGRWQQAITKDALPWTHVSDLRKWKNEAAQLYGVRSIPHTILLDKQGRIIAQKLRSHQLEQELIKIFGF